MELRERENAFLALKHSFSTVPVLVTPDSSAQFVLEFDVSDTGVRAVLSQRSSQDNRMHPCDLSVFIPRCWNGDIVPEASYSKLLGPTSGR